MKLENISFCHTAKKEKRKILVQQIKYRNKLQGGFMVKELAVYYVKL